VFTAGGRSPTGIDLIEWVKKAENLGAGEILLTSMDKDGTKSGFDLEMLKAVCAAVRVPVIASGGGGTLQHFADVFTETECTAALAASLFHYGELTIAEVKAYLAERNISVRI
jgi:cyclase